MDIPLFDTATLARLETLTVSLSSGTATAWPETAEATFKVLSALKPSSGAG